MLPPRLAFVLSLALPFALNGGSAATAEKPVDYLTEIKPLLSEKCFSCHSALRQEADLRLETLGLMLEHGIVEPGNSDESELIRRVIASADERMPPPEEGAAMQPDQVDLLKRWIDQGARAPDEEPPAPPSEHWAFRPLRSVQASSEMTSDRHPIDSLLESKRAESGVRTVAPTTRPLLIRRLYLDLIGLPPNAEQLRDDRPVEEIVDALLASPAYGERWGRHWMDVWRYSDWYGLGAQIRYSQKHIWRWRDWIVASLNNDKGYDRMICEMIAGDELAPDDTEALTGTGFLARNYYLFNRTTWLDSTIEHTGKAFLGLTLNCAKCHDHKYDPISQVDYYRFRALLEPHQIRLDPIPGVTDYEQDGLPRAFDDSVDRPTYLHVKGDPKNEDQDQPMTPGFPAILASFAPSIRPVPLPTDAYAPGTRDDVVRDRLLLAEAEIETAKKQLGDAKANLAEQPPTTESSVASEQQPFEFHDTFDEAAPDVWKLVGDGWEYRDGALHQARSTRERHHVRLRQNLPRDFEVECRFTTTGGATYRSVTFRFDQSEDGKNANYVYTSAHASGPKVQVAYTRSGSDAYPPAGRKALPIETGRQYRLRFALRGTLVNVWLDGEFVVAFEFPDRREGFFSLSGFDATVAFDEIRIKSLPPETRLTAATNTGGSIPSDPKTVLKTAELKLARAVANLESLRATIAADRARYIDEVPAEKVRELSLIAAKAQLRHQIADAEHRIVSDAADAKKLKQAQDQRKTLGNALRDIDPSKPQYESLRGSKKALESPADKESDYAPVYPSVSTGRRLALAKWITSEQNPLTARVAVNHVWMRHFGTPLVESVFDFGLRAEEPLQIELLNYLAADFIASGWSFKHLHRRIVTSQAYRLQSGSGNADPETKNRDPENRYYWRANPRRMESQLVRDALLELSQTLDRRLGGPSVDPDANVVRRSLYLKHSRDQQDKFLSMFDDADILQCYRRSESIVPQQALALSNSKLAIGLSGKIASRISQSLGAEDSDDAFIAESFFVLLGRDGSDQELGECRRFLDQLRALPPIRSLSDSDRSSRVRGRLVQALINHNDFISIR